MSSPLDATEFQLERLHPLGQRSVRGRTASESEVPMLRSSSPRRNLSPDECLVAVALAVIGIQIQVHTSASIATSAIARVILSLGITFESFGLLLVLCFSTHSSQALPAIFSFVCRVPTIPILIGILALAATIILEAANASLGVAIAMGCILAVGGVLCLLASLLRATGKL